MRVIVLALLVLSACDAAGRLRVGLEGEDNTHEGDPDVLPDMMSGACTDDDGDGYFTDAGCGMVDCDDGDANAHEMVQAFPDQDGDGYTLAAIEVCAKTGALPAGHLAAASATADCDDTDDRLYRIVVGYKDLDGDDYTAGSAFSMCVGAVFPAGYDMAASATADCADNSALFSQVKTYYFDRDGDGHGSTDVAFTQCAGPDAGSGYSFTNDDCNDVAADPRATLYWNCSRAATCIDADLDTRYAAQAGDGSGGCDRYLPSADCNDASARQWDDCSGPCGDLDKDGAEAHCDDIPSSQRDCDDTTRRVRPWSNGSYTYGPRYFPELLSDPRDNDCYSQSLDLTGNMSQDDAIALYVSTSGVDDLAPGRGTQALPFRTIAYAAGQAYGSYRPILVAEGTYNEAPINTGNSIFGGFVEGPAWTTGGGPTIVRVTSGKVGVSVTTYNSPIALAQLTIEHDPSASTDDAGNPFDSDECTAVAVSGTAGFNYPYQFAHVVLADVVLRARTRGLAGCADNAIGLRISGGNQLYWPGPIGIQANKYDTRVFIWGSTLETGPAQTVRALAIGWDAIAELDGASLRGGAGGLAAVGIEFQGYSGADQGPPNGFYYDLSRIILLDNNTIVGRQGGTTASGDVVGVRQNASGYLFPSGSFEVRGTGNQIFGCRSCGAGLVLNAEAVRLDDPTGAFVLQNVRLRGAEASPTVNTARGFHSLSQTQPVWVINSIVEGGTATNVSAGVHEEQAGPLHFIDCVISPADTGTTTTTYGVHWAQAGWGGYTHWYFDNYIASGAGTGTAIAFYANSSYSAAAYQRPGLQLFHNVFQLGRAGAIALRHRDNANAVNWDTPDMLASRIDNCDSQTSQQRVGGAADGLLRYACAAPAPSGDGAHGNQITNRAMSLEFVAPATSDYHLLPSSILIGAGQRPYFPLGQLLQDGFLDDALFDSDASYRYLKNARDWDGEARPTGTWDVGVDER